MIDLHMESRQADDPAVVWKIVEKTKVTVKETSYEKSSIN